MRFKEWLFNEMPHMGLPSEPINGIVGNYIDFRAEDWGKGLQSGNLVPRIDTKTFMGPWAAKIQEGWLIHDGTLKLRVVPELDERSATYKKLPPHWWDFATVVTDTDVVKGPEWPRSEYEKVTVGSPPVSQPSSQPQIAKRA